VTELLQAPLEIGFDYTRSPGPVLNRFLAGLAKRRILGAQAADGRVHVPPFEYDPVTFAPPDDLVEVAAEGTVVTWCPAPEPLEGQPLDRPFAWALIRLDGADTSLLHAVDAHAVSTGMRVRARWADTPAPGIRAIACFEPVNTASEPVTDQEPPESIAQSTPSSEVNRAIDPQGDDPQGDDPRGDGENILVTPVNLHYVHTASPGEAAYMRGLAEGKLLGQRCPQCRKVYIPTRGTCPADGVPMNEQVELPDVGTITTFCVVNVPYPGQKLTPPYVAAAILLDGADIAFQHLISGCDVTEVRMGMRVKAHWKQPAASSERATIDYFEPAGEPDAPYESYAGQL
jgi:hypothetical protein